ncbi:MAG: hypothetical protein KFW21_00725 [Spirochaetota bacterium]|nr:hypothetical protein [Spirochaetota bacterium]
MSFSTNLSSINKLIRTYYMYFITFCCLLFIFIIGLVIVHNKYTTIQGSTFQEALLQSGQREISFCFDQDIIKFSSYEESSYEWLTLMNLSFTPNLSGSIRTISGKKFTYTLDTPLPPNQDIIVSYNTNITSLTGAPVSLSINYQQSSSSPFIIKGKEFKVSYASLESKNLYSPIYLSISRAIKIQELKKGLTLSDQYQNIKFRLKYAIRTNQKNSSTFCIVTNYNEIYIFPYGLKKNTSYKLEIDYSKINTNSILKPFIYEFDTYKSPEWLGLNSTPYLNQREPKLLSKTINDDLWLVHNTPIKKTAVTNSILTTIPAVSNLSYSIKESNIQIYGDFVGNTEYLLSFTPKKLFDIYGQKITNVFTAKFDIQNQKPAISQMKNILYIDRKNPIVPFQTVNVSNITITYQIINSAYYTALSLYGKNVPVNTYKTNFSINSPIDQISWQEFDLTKIFEDQTSLILMNIQNTDQPSKDTNFTKILASQSGLMAHISISDIVLQAHDIDTQNPLENIMISIWDPIRGSFQDLGRTKSDGFLRVPNAKLPLKALEKPIFIGIPKDTSKFNEIAFLSGDDSYFNSINSTFFFSSSPRLFYNDITTTQHIYSMVFTDRPTYKLGEQVHIHAIARAKTNNYYTSQNTFFTKSVDITIINPNNTVITNTLSSWSSNGSLNITLNEKQTLISGQYTIKIKNTSSDFYKQAFFNVYPLTPKNTEIVFSAPKQKILFGEKLVFSLRPQFLFGEILPSTISYTVTKTPLNFISKKYAYYQFGTAQPITPYDSPIIDIYPQLSELLLKNTQKSSLKKPDIIINKKLSDYSGKNYQLCIQAKTISDSTLSTEINNNTLSVFQPVQLGIHLENTTVFNNEAIAFKIIALNSITEEIITNIQSVLTINKIEKLTLGKWSFITNIIPLKQYYSRTIFSKTMKNGQYSYQYIPSQEGNYQVIVHTYSNNTKISSSTSFSVLKSESSSYNTQLYMELDNTTYQSGDTAFLHISNPFDKARLLLFIERDSIREFHSIILSNNIFTYPIALTHQDIPGINITAILSSISNTKNIPLTLFGNTSLTVRPNEKQLSFQINTSKSNYLPKELVEIDLMVYNAQNKQIDGEAVVIIRDKAVLEQTDTDIPNPIDIFYNTRYPGFSTWHSGKQLLDTKNLTNTTAISPMPISSLNRKSIAFANPISTSLMDNIESSSQVRSNFPYTIYYNSSVQLSRNKKTKISFQLPDNISGFDITVIAYDQNELFGKTNYNFTSSKKLMIDEIIPNFVRPDDQVTWGAYIRNFSDSTIDAKVTLDNVDSYFTKNILIPKKSYAIVTNTNTIKNIERSWNILVDSTNFSDNFIKNIPVILDNPWTYSSYSGYLNNTTNITLETDLENNLEQEITLQLSSTPMIQMKNSLNKILTSESLYIEQILQRLLLFIGNEDLFITNQLIDWNKKKLNTLLQDDLNSLSSYYINSTNIATSPLGNIITSNPMILLQMYESLQLANKHNYQIDSNLFNNLTKTTQQISKKNKNTSANDALIQIYALNILASNKLLDKESFKNIYPILSSYNNTHALILDTMHLLNFPLQDISKQTLLLMNQTTETGTTILIKNSNSRFIASTLIKYYGDYQDGFKILNGLDIQKQDNIFVFVNFLQKYPSDNTYKVDITINKKTFTLDNTNNKITIPIKEKNISITMDTEQKKIYYYLVYGSIPKKNPTQNNSGYQIKKNIYNQSTTNSIVDNNLIFGEKYIIELEITPQASGSQQIEIIDPLYGGIILDTPTKQKEYLKNATYIAKHDKIHIFTKVNKSKIIIRYLVIAQTFGIWTAPPSSVQFITSPDVFGFQSQDNITIK